ncbi:hypothetical protein GpartN1_g4820.t1 [Galdieria partita]|uniref:Sec20 C-terminal domain-containing protein n=1 Tax=Galdieria partita TaxID=83374 RepID=A0A9C7URI1_9RHOD|nr:hypothetical protein GpartN1_g4820.t1 [Galdieria partita]
MDLQRPTQLVNRIETLQTECQQRQEKLQSSDYLVQNNEIEELFQQDKLSLKQLQEAIEQLELFVAEEEEESRRYKWLQVLESSKELLQQLQRQHRLELLRWKQLKEQHQRQLLLEEQRLRRRKPHNTSEEELPHDLNAKIQSSLQNTKQVLTSQVLLTNSNLDRIRKDEQLLNATQSQHQNYSEHIQQGAQQLRSMTKKSRQSHWKLILSFILFLLICAFIVYQRLEHSSWFGVARATRVVKQSVLVTFQGLHIGLRYFWNLSIHFIFYVWELTQYLWTVWQKEPKLKRTLQHSNIQNTSMNGREQRRDEDSEKNDSVVSPITLSVDNMSHFNESTWNNLSFTDSVVLEDVKNENVKHQENIGLNSHDGNQTFSAEQQVEEEVSSSEGLVNLSNDMQGEEEEEEEKYNVFDNLHDDSETSEEQDFMTFSLLGGDEIAQNSEWMEEVDKSEENKQDAAIYNFSRETNRSFHNSDNEEEEEDEDDDVGFVTEENAVDGEIIEMYEIEESSEDFVSQELANESDENLEESI